MNVTVTVTSKRVGYLSKYGLGHVAQRQRKRKERIQDFKESWICQSMVWDKSRRDKEKGKKEFRKSDQEKDSGTCKDTKVAIPLDPSASTNPPEHTCRETYFGLFEHLDLSWVFVILFPRVI